jgi:hypothetical protein
MQIQYTATYCLTLSFHNCPLSDLLDGLFYITLYPFESDCVGFCSLRSTPTKPQSFLLSPICPGIYFSQLFFHTI